MKFTIKSDKDKEKEVEIRLWLETTTSGVIVMGVNSSGETKQIMVFRDGKFFRYGYASLEGLEVDKTALGDAHERIVEELDN